MPWKQLSSRGDNKVEPASAGDPSGPAANTVRRDGYARRASRMVVGFISLLSALACSADSSLQPSSLDLPRLTTTYAPGDLVADGNGELYPVGAAPTRIDIYHSSFDAFTCEYWSGCSVDVKAKHIGIWNSTRQVIQFYVGGLPMGTGDETGWVCTKHFYSTDIYWCTEKTADNAKTFFFNACGNKPVSATVEHRAWWIGFWAFDVTYQFLTMNIPGGYYGLVTRHSQPPTNPSTPPCAEEEGGGSEGGGGGGEPERCFNVYAIWYDPDTGEIVYSQFLYTYCVGGNVQ